MTKWILIALAIPVGLLLLAVIVGLFIPKAHRATRTVKYHQSPEVVWEVISDFASHPSWRSDVKQMQRLKDRQGLPVWREVHTRGDAITMAVIESDPPHRMVTRIVDNRQFGGTWTWEVGPAHLGSCTLTITENGTISNPIFRLVARSGTGYHATMDRVFRALGEHFDEVVTLEEPTGDS